MIPWLCFFICYIWAGIAACVIADDVTEGEITIPVLIILLLFWWYLPIHIFWQNMQQRKVDRNITNKDIQL